MPMSAISSGGSNIAAGIRNTIVVWYDWFTGRLRTTKSCATAAIRPRIAKVVHPGVLAFRRAADGSATTTAVAATITKYAAAFGASLGAPGPAGPTRTSSSIGAGKVLTTAPRSG